MQHKPSKTISQNNDPLDPRLIEFVTHNADTTILNNTNPNAWTLLGYPDDEGILINNGKPGAKDAPEKIRKYLYRMTPPSKNINFSIIDLGDLQTGTLNNKHEEGRKIVFKNLKSGKRHISLGGGHDYGFPDAAGFLDYIKNNDKFSEEKPLVINFDAHLDVRPLTKGLHSGTPFRRLLEEFKDNLDFFEIGLQPQCNSIYHKEWALEQGAKLYFMNIVEEIGLIKILSQAASKDTQRPLWISLDIDVFSSSEAPGCSQSWATGIKIQEFLQALHYLVRNFNVMGIGIYEVSPPLDQDDRTSKLAALIIYHLIFSHQLFN